MATLKESQTFLEAVSSRDERGICPIIGMHLKTHRGTCKALESAQSHRPLQVLRTFKAPTIIKERIMKDWWIFSLSRFASIVAAFIYGIMLIYIFPLYVHYHNHFFYYLKNATLIAIYSPIRTIYAIGACLTLYYLFFKLLVLIFFLGPSLTSFVIMRISFGKFIRIESRQVMLQDNHLNINNLMLLRK